MNDHQLARIEESGIDRVVSKPSADHASAVDDTRGVFGKDPLPRGVRRKPKRAPLSAMGVSAYSQVDVGLLDVGHKVFGMVAEQDTKALGFCKGLER